MAKKNSKRDIEQYDHSGQKRKNNPPVGLVSPDTDQDAGKKAYAYAPHLDPSLQWAGKAIQSLVGMAKVDWTDGRRRRLKG